ncbi:GNAT family N-acetyltransferase [Plantactinospora sp. KBS50]|uniref:GNAT family N-acetyltransferase n=1 Tax=Plantactinospora sp. KBS50 TaxID=2024580 RepID=UPI000BAACBAC|nr:GNAT family N-acetyltransferase [Plantactinospora sp. KBS50]ASW55201.1 GNAT family N-acetyltransferase [Plantactinospora sp. KBS50]
MAESPSLEFHADPGAFLAAAGDHLAADAVVSTVVTTMAHRAAAQPAPERTRPDRTWWLVVRDAAGAVTGAAMRTATFPPYPPYLLSMPDDAAVALARALHSRAEEVGGINGALPAVDRCAAELARLGGGRVRVGVHTRLHELGDLVAPARVPGRLAVATEDDLDLVVRWWVAFRGDADEQAGRARADAHDAVDREDLRRRIRAGWVWLWRDGRGEAVHLTAASPPAFGVARVGPVYTPPGQRGRGWASNAVAEVSQRIRAGGARVCLFTDQANPTSNRIYAALGYRPVVDMAHLVVSAGPAATVARR